MSYWLASNQGALQYSINFLDSDGIIAVGYFGKRPFSKEGDICPYHHWAKIHQNKLRMARKRYIGKLVMIGLSFVWAACADPTGIFVPDAYDGPISIATNIHLVNSDSGIVRTELFAKKRLEYANGDMDFPDGIIVHYRNVAGEVTSKISADRGFFNKSENLYTGSGNVQVTNLEKKQQLNSEELFWEPNKQRIYTNAFVIIKENDRIIKGTGMEADDKFTNYKIFKSHGEIPIPGEDG